jgi:glycosyltransferase involved in cell wall biosynthesis
MRFPEYETINNEFEVALLVQDLEPATISNKLNQLLNDTELYERLHQSCIKAREQLNWQQEEKKLLNFYHNLFLDK